MHERVSHALQTLQRFRQRFDYALTALSALEVEDTVTMRDVAAVIQPGELVMRIAREIDENLTELGGEGVMLRLQLDELIDGVDGMLRLVVRDYLQTTARKPERALEALRRLTTEELADAKRVGAALGLPDSRTELDASLEPHGYRALHRLARFPDALVERVVQHFAGLQKIMRASVGDLEEVEGVGEARARSLKVGLSRQAETSILDRYT
jgi:diadenylate cyclase